MKPTIIANMGEGNVGKTESIIMVYEKLKNVAESEKDQVGTKLSEKDQVKEKDICEVVEINGVKVGIASDGDTKERVKEHLEYFKNNDCKIILIASRANNPMVKLLKDFANKNTYRLWRTSNARIYEEVTRVAPRGIQHRFNEHWAEEIARMIEDWCYAG